MKNLFSRMVVAAVPALALIAVVAAKMFAAMPCIGLYYEPELPEELIK